MRIEDGLAPQNMNLIKPIKSARSSQSAFTFVEVMIGMAIMVVLFTSLFAGMTMGLGVTQMSRENQRATQIMADKMEGVRLYTWDQLTNGTFLKTSFTNYFYETNGIETANSGGNGIVYTGSISVASAPLKDPAPSYVDSCRLVTVQVGWYSGNVLHSRSMVTLYSQKGLQNYVYNGN
jgi:type II secretory pathway pseudopilin PulG